ncbi:MAG: pyruvate formate lyase-activating protein [Elusimicrobiota bacterium]|jgi:pyruvate formate lyase activating enzyme|nr:pyruvate formate lyase-activating protein [Elusimicrobiota bacterium]
MSENLGNIHSIETFGAFDGPGIRFVVFFQGCPFKCKFCHNRDTWNTNKNTLMSAKDILKTYDKYAAFYKKGGITASGGEPTLQISFLTKLFQQAKSKKIHTVLDTAAACYKPALDKEYKALLKFTDLVLLDIKHIDNEKHKNLTGASNTSVLDFAKFLDKLKVKTVIRFVLTPKYSSDKKDLKDLRKFLDGLSNIIAIEILPYHNKGISKWEKLGVIYPLINVKEPSKEEVIEAQTILKEGYKLSDII